MAETPIHYRWDGNEKGPVLVLSHSLGASLEMWEPQVAALGKHFRLLRYDHRGHGRSGCPDGPWDIADFGHDLVGLLDRLGLERVHFCGLSLGGIVGLWLGQQAPERLGRLVLCNCSATIEDTTLLRGRMTLIERAGLEAVVGNIVERWLSGACRERQPDAEKWLQAMILATPAEGYLRTCEALCRFDLRPGLGGMKTPSLAIHGAHDLATPPAWTQAFAEAMPDCQQVELDSAHLSNVEAADAFNAAVESFLMA